MQSMRGKREKGRGEKDCEPVTTKRGCKKKHRGEKKKKDEGVNYRTLAVNAVHSHLILRHAFIARDRICSFSAKVFTMLKEIRTCSSTTSMKSRSVIEVKLIFKTPWPSPISLLRHVNASRCFLPLTTVFGVILRYSMRRSLMLAKWCKFGAWVCVHFRRGFGSSHLDTSLLRSLSMCFLSGSIRSPMPIVGLGRRQGLSAMARSYTNALALVVYWPEQL